MRRIQRNDLIAIKLLEFSPFERHPRGWRFGARTITPATADFLIATGRAEIVGNQLRLKPAEAK